ncbi:MAG: hypothetical protein C4346_20115, partial [Chloroflexota bacterium]
MFEVGGFPNLKADAEPATIRLLRHRGYLVYRDAAACLTIKPPATRPTRFIAEAFWRGTARGHLILATTSADPGHPVSLAQRVVRHTLHRLPRITRRLGQHPAPAAVRLAAAPLIALGELAAWLGMAYSLAVAKQTLLHVLGWNPTHLLLLIGRAQNEVRQVAIVRLDGCRGELRGVSLPLSLRVQGLDGREAALADAAANVRTRTDALAIINGAVGIGVHDVVTVSLDDLGWDHRPASAPPDDLRWTLTAVAAAISPVQVIA